MKCPMCGKEPQNQLSAIGDFCSSECFEKDFWQSKKALYDSGQAVVINSKCYFIGDETQRGPACFRGFGGRKFTIKKNDGAIITTANLSSNGAVPDKYREMLPDNAEFVDPTKM